MESSWAACLNEHSEWERVCLGCGREQVNTHKKRWIDQTSEEPSCPSCVPGKAELPTVTEPYPTTKLYRQEEWDRVTTENADLRRQLSDAKDARIAADLEAADLRVHLDRKARLIESLNRETRDLVIARNAALALAGKYSRCGSHSASYEECCPAQAINSLRDEVARFTPHWTDGPPDRVGPWLRVFPDGRLHAANMNETDARTTIGAWEPSRWLYLGDFVEVGKAAAGEGKA